MPQSPTVSLPKRLPLILEPENRDESTRYDSKIINGYVEHNQTTDEYWIYKRPGLTVYNTFSGIGYGICNWQGIIYSIFGGTFYQGSLPIASVDTTGGTYHFSASLGDTPRLQLGNAVTAYNWDNVSLKQMSGVNFPGNIYPAAPVKGWAYLDGTTYILDATAYVHGSDSAPGMNRPDLWDDYLNLIGAQIEPDRGVFLAKQLVYVIVMKEWSTEVFYDALNPVGASPLAPVQGAKINYGCISGESVQELDGTLIWLATNRSSAVQVVRLDNLKPMVISTKAIERLLGEADFSAVASFTVKYEGHRFYGVTLKNDNLTLVYDMTDQRWAQWTSSTGDYFKAVSSTFLGGTGHLLQHETDGKIYKMDASSLTDAGELITVDLYTPNFDGGVRRRKQMTMQEFIADQVSGSSIQVRVNDYDYDPTKWTVFRTVDLSVRKPVLVNCGTFMRRATHIRHAAATRFRLQAIEMQLDLGTL